MEQEKVIEKLKQKLNEKEEEKPLIVPLPVTSDIPTQNTQNWRFMVYGGVALVVGVTGVVLYIVSTEDQPDKIIAIQSILSNLAQNSRGAYHSIIYLRGNSSTLIEKIVAFIGAVACSAPFSIATYTFTEGTLPKKIGFASLEFTGNMPLFLYSLFNLIKRSTPLYYSASNLVRNIFSCEDAETKRQRKNIALVRHTFLKSLETLSQQFWESEKKTSYSNPFPSGQIKQLEYFADELGKMIDNIPAQSNESNFWKSGFGKMLRLAGWGGENIIKVIFGTTVAWGAVGYQCGTKNIFNTGELDEAGSWSLSSLAMGPFYYLALLGGWDVAKNLFYAIRCLINGKSPTTTLVELAGKRGWAMEVLLVSLAGFLNYSTGYTASMLFKNQCPDSFQFPGSINSINYSTAVFNAIYFIYVLRELAITYLHKFNGKPEKKYWYDAVTSLEALIEKIQNMSDADFLNFGSKTLAELSDNVLGKFLGNNNPELPGHNIGNNNGSADERTLLLSNNSSTNSTTNQAANLTVVGLFRKTFAATPPEISPLPAKPVSRMPCGIL